MPDGYQTASGIAAEALAGLTASPKTLPAKLFYDEEGCRLFGAITRLPEYYVTRTELALLARLAPELHLPNKAALIEYGASDEAKAALLLPYVQDPAYVPIDVAQGALDALAARMAASHPAVPVHPIAADFLRPLPLPASIAGRPRVGFFPGSTIGNLDPAAAVAFLRQAAAALGAGSAFVVGVDLQKDPAILVPAYDDALGVTAAFNCNLLARLNREAGADFDLARFRHRAVWNADAGRIEMHLESTVAQTATVAGTRIAFAAGETIHTENSYKHTVSGFQALAARAGWSPAQVWVDDAALVSVHLLRAVG